jgi:hypothetical protein
MFRFYVALAISLISASLALTDEPARKLSVVKVTGAIEKPAEWTAETLAKEFAGEVKVVSYTVKEQSAKAKVVPLAKVIAAAKPKLDPKQKNHAIAFCVVVRGTDGYAATFSWGELMPEFGGAAVYLALDRDGGPLPENQRPMSLLLVGDKKPSRWVHGIATITVIDGLSK